MKMKMNKHEIMRNDDGSLYVKAKNDIEFYLEEAIKMKMNFKDHYMYKEFDINQIANMLREQEIFLLDIESQKEYE